MTIGSFVLIKNEAPWIAAHLAAWLPLLDQMVFADGGSRDGTLEIIEAFKSGPNGHKITLYHDDPKDLQGDYVRAFDACMKRLGTDLAFFLHPDMIPVKAPADFSALEFAFAASVKMRSFAGEPDGQLYEIKGRAESWKNIYRLRNPDLGAHYHGFYGAWNEDVYFKAITGNAHVLHRDLSAYPYEVVDSGLEVLHFSDVRTPRRRYERMVSCLMNQGHSEELARELGSVHPRVTLKNGGDFTFLPASYPPEFVAAREKYRHLEKEPSLA